VSFTAPSNICIHERGTWGRRLADPREGEYRARGHVAYIRERVMGEGVGGGLKEDIAPSLYALTIILLSKRKGSRLYSIRVDKEAFNSR
jgi:hypothetical protein